MNIQLDQTDRALLAALQENARIPQAALGARVGLSPAAVNRRLQKLVSAGFISSVSAVLAPEKLGYPLTVITQVEVENQKAATVDRVRTAFLASPYVQQCYTVTGGWDFVLIFLVEDMQRYGELSRELLYENADVKRFMTLVVVDRTKVSLDLPIPGSSAAG
jgi:DNA-binding Lrp family transcriptional regulator